MKAKKADKQWIEKREQQIAANKKRFVEQNEVFPQTLDELKKLMESYGL